MNKRIKKIIACVVLGMTLFNKTLNVEACDIMFLNTTVQEGLTQGTVRAIFQDSNGYIWIGTTDGLNKYNGYDYEKYSKGINKKESIINGFIHSINEDKNKNLWVGTAGGISKINLVNGKISNYSSYNSNLGSTEVADVVINDRGVIFVSTPTGLYMYDEANDNFNNISKVEFNYCYSLNSNNNNVYGVSDKGIFEYNTDDEKFTYIENDAIKDKLSFDHITDINVDNEKILIGTKSSGVIIYNKNNGSIDDEIKYYKDNNNKECYSVTEIFIEKSGKILIGTVNGLVIYDKDKNQKVYNYDDNDKYTINNNNVLSIFQDSSGLIWAGTYSGLNIFELDEGIDYYHYSNKEKSLLGNIIHGIYEDPDELLWIGCFDMGVTIFDKKSNMYKHITTKDGLNSNVIGDIKGNDKNIFVATLNGINIIDRKTEEITYIDDLEGLFCNSLLVDGDRLFVGTNSGIYIVNLNDYSVSNLNDLYKSLNVQNYLTGAIFKDSNDELWIGLTINGGLIRYNEVTGESNIYLSADEQNSISDNSIVCISEDKSGTIWIGTTNGLNKFNKENETFTVYSSEDGITNNTIYSVIFDKNNNLWISTNAGVESLNVDENNKLIVKKHIKNGEFNYNGAFKLKDGNMAFGSMEGLYIVDPYKLSVNEFNPDLKIDTVKVNGITINDLNKMNLDYKNSSISFSLFTTDYDNAKNIKYYYKIDNVSEEWTMIEGNEITFSKFSPGRYNIRFKALNSDGLYSDKQVVTFNVKSPFWSSNTAKIIYMLNFLIITLYIFLKIKKMDKTIEKRNNQLDKEMQKKNELLLKVLKLEQRKNNYLINISHELRTPLNVISSIQQLVLSLSEKGEMSMADLNKYMNMAMINVNRLLKLINDLMDSSKIDCGRFKLFKEEVNIVYVIEDAAASIKNLADQKNISLIFDTEIEEYMMKIDRHAIDRCIVNIVNNAAKFTENGGEIFVNFSLLGEDKVKIEIKDNGCGISDENINLIFDRFNQGNCSKKAASVGSGLGLTITKRLIELHGGEIFVSSEEGKGSLFTIVLPKE